jgi:uncharacterized protein (DUF111 family)
LWRFKIQTLLQVKKLWGLIDMIKMKLEVHEVFTIVEYMKKENKARNLLVHNLISNNQLMIICRETTAHGVWEAFEKWCVDRRLAHKIFLTNFFWNMS